MTVRSPRALALAGFLVAAAALAAEQRLRYTFENKKRGDSTVPHEIHRGARSELESPFAPKGKELETSEYSKVGNESDDKAGASADADAKDRATLLVVFKLEQEVAEAVKAWTSVDLEVAALAGPAGEEHGPEVECESYRADKKSWAVVPNDLPEGVGHHYATPGPFPGLVDREGRIAYRISCKTAGKPNRVTLGFVRLVVKLEQAGGGDSLTYSSLPGRCKLTRPDDPLWRFDESDDWFIRLVKGDDNSVDLTVTRYDSESNYTFGDRTLSGDNAKGLAEANLEKLIASYKVKTRPKVAKGQVGAYKTQEFSLTGEAKADGAIMEIREIFIREKGNTYRISVWGKAQIMKQERFPVERVLESFTITE